MRLGGGPEPPEPRLRTEAKLRLDIVFPAHNEEHRIDRTLHAYRSACPGAEVRFLVALDRCTDSTPAIVRSHAAADPRIHALEYPKLGKGGVIVETFRRSDADLVGFVDADCATPPSEMLRLAEISRETDGAIASRRHPASILPAQRPVARRIASAGFAFGVRRLMGLPYSDTQCGAKVLRRHVVDEVVPRLASRDLLFDVDLLATANELGYSVVEVPTVWIDQAGSRVSAVSDSRRMGTSLLKLWSRRRLFGAPGSPANTPDAPLSEVAPAHAPA
jgi:glycosyltransferase involved in cell wall biosynthesis